MFTRVRVEFTAVFLLAALVLAACGTPAATDEPADGERPTFVYITPNPIGVNAFLQLGREGVEQAGEKHNAETSVLESENPSSIEENVRAAVSENADVVVVIGFEFADTIQRVAPQAPDVQFLIIDQCIDNPPPNVRCAVFREYEAAYLIGAEAGLLTESNKVGVIGALDIPFLHRYTDPFAEGARAVNPDVDVSTLWVGTDPSAFSDPARAKEQALAMAAQGADHIFAAAAASNFGIFEAAQEQEFFSYGVDVNQCEAAEGRIVDNLLKRVDNVTVQSIDAIMAGEGEQVVAYGLKEEGIGIVPFALEDAENSGCVIMDHPDVIERLEEIQQQIIDGEIQIQDPMAAQ